MTPIAVVRSVGAATVVFAVVTLLLSAMSHAASTGSDGQYIIVGATALLAPFLGVLAGAWQARAAGTRRPIVGLAVAAAVPLLAGLALFGPNETLRDGFTALQPVLVVAGALAGAVVYGGLWFGSTARV